jgi:hypothetical protein
MENLYKLIIPSYILLLLVMVFSCIEESKEIKEIIKIEYRDTCIGKPPIIKWEDTKIETLYLPGVKPILVTDTNHTYAYEMLAIDMNTETVISSYKDIDTNTFLYNDKVYKHYNKVYEWMAGIKAYLNLKHKERN